MEQGEQEYPPGTVGYLAQGLGWRTVASREPVVPAIDDDADPTLPTDSEPQPLREPRLATPVPEQQPGSAEPHDVHTDEDDEFDDFEFDDGLDGDLNASSARGRDHREERDLREDGEDRAQGFGGYPYQEAELSHTGHPQVRNSLFEDFTYEPDDEYDPVDEPPISGTSAGPDRGRTEPDEGPAHNGHAQAYSERDQAHEAYPGTAGGEGPDEEPPEPRPASGYWPPSAAAGVAGMTAGSAAGAAAEPRSAGRWTEPGAVAAEQAQRARNGELIGPDGELASARLLRQTRRPPRSGWRRALYVVSGRTVNLGEGRADQNERELITRVNKPLHGCYKIAMLSLKGGVGKTTVTATLGATFASLRGDRVIAVDANPDRGTLSQKIPLETSATVRHLLRDAQRVRRYTDVRAYTSQGPSRLEVLASEQDPAVSEAFSEEEYRRTVNLLEHFYNVVLTDCGTGLMHSAMYGVLGLADALVIVSSGSIDGARSASATMDWLDAHGHGDLVANSVAVINSVRRNSGGVDLDRVAEHFAARCRKVIRVPFDSHLEEGAEIDLDRLSPHTRAALLELAASVADNFPSSAP